MKKILFSTLVILTTFANAQSTDKIIGGVSVESFINHLYPWQVRYTIQTTDKRFACGGTLIAPQWILTAAHCLLREEYGRAQPSELAVNIGAIKKSQLNYTHKVKNTIIHKDFELKTYRNDIALLQLNQPIRDAQTMNLSDKNSQWDLQRNSRLKVSGWGAEFNNNKKSANTLNIIDLSLLNPKTCQQTFDIFDDNQLCAGEPEGGKDSCNGDSGGPLFRGVADKAVQYGIVSYGKKMCGIGKPSVYTRVADYADWIEKNVQAVKFTIEPTTQITIPKVPKGKRALLVGVEDYYLINDLMGIELDVKRMRQLLVRHFGFRDDQILTLQNKNATAENIRYAVKHWLIDGSAKGDSVWFYFSGHGSFLLDESGDEKIIDHPEIGISADETILPYDLDILSYIEKYSDKGTTYVETINHILDDEVYEWRKQLANRDLNMVFDSCHSGTMYRAIDGQSKSGIEAIEGFINQKIKLKLTLTRKAQHGSTAKQSQYIHKDIGKNEANWSAVTATQKAQPTPNGSTFTNVFITGVRGKADLNNDGEITYTELLSYVRMKSGNTTLRTPQLAIDSQRLNTSIFSHRPIDIPQAVAEQVLTNDNPHKVKIQWLNAETLSPAKHLTYCPDNNAPSCPDYRIQVTSAKAGWLLLYELSESGELQQYLPNETVEDQFPQQYTGEISANQPFVFPINLRMDSRKRNELIAIVFAPEEKANYDRIAKTFFATERVNKRVKTDFFYTAIDQRDRVIDGDGHLLPWSVTKLAYQAQ